MKNKVRVYRESLKMTQSDLAHLVGVTRQTIYLIEIGEYNPTLKLCKKICKVFEKNLSSIFDCEE